MKPSLLAAAGLMFTASAGLAQSTLTWISGGSGGWQTASNWSNSQIAGSGDTVVLVDTYGATLAVDSNRSAANIQVNRTGASIIDRFSTNGVGLTLSNNLIGSSGALTIRRIGLTVSGTMQVNGQVNLGDRASLSNNSASTIYNVSVGTTQVNSGGSVSVTRIVDGNTVNLGSLVMTSGTLNLTVGAGSNGSDTAVENIVTVSQLQGSGVVQADKASSKGALVVNGTGKGVFSGNIENGASGATVRLTKSGAGSLELTNASHYSGATLVNGGTLFLTGTGSINQTSGITLSGSGKLASSSSVGLNRNVTLNGGTLRYNSASNYTGALTFTAGTLEGTNWNGNLGGQTIGSGKIISPGNSPGVANTTSQVWQTGGSYNWQVYDAAGEAGTGFDTINFSSTLDLTQLSKDNQFNLNVWSLSSISPDSDGDALNFDAGANYSWLIASANQILIGDGVDVNDLFTINLSAIVGVTGGFSNVNDTGAWSVSVGGATNNQLYLNYQVIPEPNASLLAIAVGAAMLVLRRRKA